MNTLFTGVLSASILCSACKNKEDEKVFDGTTSMNQDDCAKIASAIQLQYDNILRTYNPQESLLLRLSDQTATLLITVQNKKIIMAQIGLRNRYPNDPYMEPTPYTDIHGDGVLETYPADKKTLPNSSLTYSNYLGLLTRFGIPKEVITDAVVPQKNEQKNRKLDIARDIMPPSSEIFSRIAQ